VEQGLKAVALGKRFPGVVALEEVSLTVQPGKVLALVGANGAGKSTLIKILTGFYDHYDGHVEIDGRSVAIHQPADASRIGIQAVYQEVDTVLVPGLTVSENVLLNQYVRRGAAPLLHWSRLHEQAEAALARAGLRLDVRRRVEDLVLHEKQMLVIARAVAQQVRYLIFDEPTTSLSLKEVGQLFEIIRALKAQGVGIIYISHRLMEVAAIADEVIVLRNGRKITQFPVAEFDVGRISEAMLGTAITEVYPPKGTSVGGVVLEAEGLSRQGKLRDVHLQVRQGEILGVAGLVGAGKTELLRALFGADALDGGRVRLDGAPVHIRSPQDAVARGLFLIPEERRAQGVLVEEKVRKNISLPFLGQFTWALEMIDRARETRHAVETIGRLGVHPPNPEAEIRNLSGGNQQKVVIGKWLAGKARVLMFDEATQGIDVKAKQDVYHIVRQLSQDAAVIYASSDIDEVIGIADRIIVMHDGAVVAQFPAETFDRNLILEYATGARKNPQSSQSTESIP
jgi:simple sugar transport system ATP-binding protein